MKPAEIILPDAVAVGEAVKGWTATQPPFALLLKSGVPLVRALTGWGLDLLRTQRINEGIEVLRAAVALAPRDPIMWANYGIALGEGKFAGEAAASLQYSLKLLPQQPTTWLMLGLARKSLGEFAAAENAYRTSLEQAPASGVGWQLIAAVKEELRDFAGAIECMEACIKVDGEGAAPLANLARLHYQLGHFAESCAAYRKAAVLDQSNAHFRQMAAKTTFLQSVLQGESIDDAMAIYRQVLGPAKTFSDEEKVDLLRSCFPILSGFAQVEAATRVGRKQMELCPTDPSLTYLLSAVSGDQTFDRSPPEYVVAHFDAFAEGFDAQLVGVLDYDIPEKLCAAIREITVVGKLHVTLDAGCGTGLCGPLLRPLSRTLAGVDLSPKMLDQACRKQVYDTLVCEELTAYLGRSTDVFDLIVAADLMIYFGDLTALFRAVSAALKTDGFFALSTEFWSGEGYKLLPSGRFSHSPKYVRFLAGKEFAELRHFETTIRLDANRRLPGDIFILQKREKRGE